MANPWDSSPIVQQAGSAFIPGTGPAAPSGYQRTAGGLTPIAGGPQDPNTAAAMAAAEAAARARASTPIEVGGQIAAAQAKAQIETQAALQRAMAERQLGPQATAKDRSEAIDRFRAAERIGNRVSDLRRLYAEGPGATKGIAGLTDYFPTTSNQRFDAAGTALRGDIGAALGFTGGQLNSIQEAKLNIGAYIPEAGDRDEVIQDKLARLEELVNSTRAGATQMLGGVPDSQGRIQPIQQREVPAAAVGNQGNPPSGGSGGNGGLPNPFTPTGPAAPVIGLATGSTRNEMAPQASALIDAGIRSGLTDNQINASLKAIGFNQTIDAAQSKAARDYLAANPDYKGSFGQATQQVANDALNQAASSPVGAYFTNAADALTVGTLDNLSADPAAARANMELQRQQNPLASTLGSISGGVLAAGGLEAGLGAGAARLGGGAISRLLANPITADTAYGAAYGAGSADEGSRTLGAIVGGGVGAGAGMFGRGLARGAGNAARGVRNEAVQYLRGRNIPLTFGQTVGQSGTLGQIVRGVEDRLSGIPGVGSVVGNRYREGLENFSREAFDQGLAPINATTGGVVGEAGIDAARAARSQAYDDALNGVRVNADPTYTTEFQAAQQAGAALPEPMRGNIDYTLNTRVGNSFGPNGELTGRDFQQAIRGLRRDTRAVGAQPYGYDFGQVAGQAEGALEGLLNRQAPGSVPAYQAANAANRNVEVLRSAVDRAKMNEGLPTPYQLAQSASQNARQFGNTQGTTQQPFFDLTRAGMQVLSNRVPDSGTAGRLATLALPGALTGAGAGAGAVGGDAGEGAKYGLGLGALAALGGSRAGQRLLTGAVASRPDRLIRIGDQIYDRARIGGMFGAGFGVGYVPALLPAQ